MDRHVLYSHEPFLIFTFRIFKSGKQNENITIQYSEKSRGRRPSKNFDSGWLERGLTGGVGDRETDTDSRNRLSNAQEPQYVVPVLLIYGEEFSARR